MRKVLLLLVFVISCSDGQEDIIVRDVSITNNDNVTNTNTSDNVNNNNSSSTTDNSSNNNPINENTNSNSTESVLNTSNSIYDIIFPSENIGYAATSDMVLKTSDGGLNWNIIYESLNGDTFSSLFFENENIGYINHGGHLYETSNGGLTFNSLWDFNDNRTSYTDVWINDIIKFNNDLFILTGRGSSGDYVGNLNLDKSQLIETGIFFNHDNFTLWKINLNERTISEIFSKNHPSYSFTINNGKIFIPSFYRGLGCNIYSYDIELNQVYDNNNENIIDDFFPLNIIYTNGNFYGFGNYFDEYSTNYHSNGNPIYVLCNDINVIEDDLMESKFFISSDLLSSFTFKSFDFEGVSILNSIVIENEIFIVGTCGSVYKSADNGISWENLSIDVEFDLYGISKISSNKLIIYGKDGFSKIIHSE